MGNYFALAALETKRGGLQEEEQKQQNNRGGDEGEGLQQKLRIFSPGDIVGLYQSDRSQSSSERGCVDGIVYKVNNEEIVIAFNEMHEFESMKQPLSAVLLANEVTYQRCKMAMQ